MANTYKNIVITPNTGSSTGDPTLVFSGANTTVNTDITLRTYPTSNGTLSIEGSAGQLFSVTNDLSGTIFSVNDISGIPAMDVNANGRITVWPSTKLYAPGHVLQVVNANSSSTNSGSSTSWQSLWTVSISNVHSVSKVMVDFRITNLIEGNEQCQWQIVRASDSVSISGILVHRSASLSGWGQSYPNLIGVDTNPTTGTNSYILQVRGVGSNPAYWWNYPDGTSQASMSYAILTEIAR